MLKKNAVRMALALIAMGLGSSAAVGAQSANAGDNGVRNMVKPGGFPRLEKLTFTGQLPHVHTGLLGLPQKPAGVDNAIDSYIRNIPALPQVSASAAHLSSAGQPQDLGIIERRRRICHTDKYSQSNSFQEIVALDPNSATIYPGSLLQGKDLLSARFAEIALPRGPLTLTVTGIAAASPTEDLSARVVNPSLASIQSAVNSIILNEKIVSTTAGLARMTMDITEVKSFEQGMLDVGVSASWLSGDFAARLRSVSTSKKNSVLVKMTQVYYEVSASPLARPSDAFAHNVTINQVKEVAYPSNSHPPKSLNPPLYVKTVKYGRMAILSIASDEQTDKLISALRASFDAVTASGKMSLDSQNETILQNSKIAGIIVGGSAASGAKLLGSLGGGDFSSFKKFVEDGAVYDPQKSPAAPISYVLTYLDNSIADSSFSADFSSTGCEDADVPIERARIAFFVGDDDKDQEMYPYIVIRDRSGRIVATNGNDGRAWASTSAYVPWIHRYVRLNAVWKDHDTVGPFEFATSGWTLADCDSATAEVGQRSSNGEDPEWHTTYSIDVLIAGRWYTIRGRSMDASEFRLGDGKPDTAISGLACPAI